MVYFNLFDLKQLAIKAILIHMIYLRIFAKFILFILLLYFAPWINLHSSISEIASRRRR